MKRYILLLLISFIGLSAKSQQTYDYRTEGNIYHSKDLTLYCDPYVNRQGVFDGVSLFPKAEHDHYLDISEYWPKYGGHGVPILNDPITLFQGALDYAFTPKQRAAFDSTQSISISVWWDINAKIYMLSIYFKSVPSLLSIPPERYARLYRYLKENIKIKQEKIYWEYETGFLTLNLTPEGIKAEQARYERAVQKYQESLRK